MSCPRAFLGQDFKSSKILSFEKSIADIHSGFFPFSFFPFFEKLKQFIIIPRNTGKHLSKVLAFRLK